MSFPRVLLLLVCTCLFHLIFAQNTPYFQERPVFENGKEGYACYRIPAIIKAPNGDLLAFAEGRTHNCHDFGNVDILLKISTDNGNSWSPAKIIADNDTLQAGNPAPLVDYTDPNYPSGRILLLFNTGTASEQAVREGKGIREVFYISSTDAGQSWSAPVNITTQVHRPHQPGYHPDYQFEEDWRSYALTPGHALQLSNGRLFVPANHSAGPPQENFNEYRSHALFSDDHGATWQLSENVAMPSSNEATAAELPNGNVMMNIRQQNGEKRQRLVAISSDGGQSWSQVFFDSTLVDPVCQASLLNYTTPDGQPALLFSNPASPNKRVNLTVRLSQDDGQSWAISRTVYSDASAYSDLVIEEQKRIGVLYEKGNQGGIHYAHFNYAWLTQK
jgi:sialidase-1